MYSCIRRIFDEKMNVSIQWIPIYSGIEGYILVDTLAKSAHNTYSTVLNMYYSYAWSLT